MQTANREFHRNGVSGKPFEVWLTDDSIGVQFYGGAETVVPFNFIQPLIDHALVGDCGSKGFRNGATQFRVAKLFNDDTIVCAYDSDAETFVGIYQPELEDMAFATFKWSLVKEGDVRFFYNSWRGDEMFWALDKIVTRSIGNLIEIVKGEYAPCE